MYDSNTKRFLLATTYYDAMCMGVLLQNITCFWEASCVVLAICYFAHSHNYHDRPLNSITCLRYNYSYSRNDQWQSPKLISKNNIKLKQKL